MTDTHNQRLRREEFVFWAAHRVWAYPCVQRLKRAGLLLLQEQRNLPRPAWHTIGFAVYCSALMLPNFLQLFGGKPAPHYEESFVHEVHVTRKRPRNPRIERLLWIGWFLILIKSVLVWWACAHYPVPFHPLWIVGPTVAFAALCTAVYLRR